MTTLAVIPCSREKIWDLEPALGAVAAREAYRSPLFVACRAAAEAHADAMVILSAYHGFLSPQAPVPGPYDVTFSRAGDPVVSAARLAAQGQRLPPGRLVLLLPDDYATRCLAALGARSAGCLRPFGGIERLDEMQRVAEALRRDGWPASR